MSVWSTKSLGHDRNYILLQHPLKGVNYTIRGVKFRDSYAVVEKDSKVYNELRKIPLLKNCKEHSLILLRKLPFVTRTIDVRMVYGEEVYRFYLQQLTETLEQETTQAVIEKEEKHVANNLCKCRTKNKELCQLEAFEFSPSGFCKFHILEDPKLVDLGIHVPRFMTKQEKPDIKEKIIKQVEKKMSHGKN